MSYKKKFFGKHYLWALSGLLLLSFSFILAGCKTTEKPTHNIINDGPVAKYGPPSNYRNN
jgi:hypothetical protein